MATFLELAQLAEELAGEAGRLKKRAAIEAAVRRAHEDAPDSEDAGLFCMYLAGQPFSEADARKLNAGGALLSRAVLAVSGATDAALTAAYRRHGDLGAAAYDLLAAADVSGDKERKGVALSEVSATFDGMARARTTAARAALVEALLRAATPIEAKYLLKLMLADMRIGVKQSLVEEAIAVAAGADVAAVRHAVMLEADLARAVQRAFAGTLGEARMTLFHPLGFMLASPVDTPEEAVARFTEPPPKPIKPPKPKKRKKGSPEDLVAAADPAEEGFAEDVEAVASESAAAQPSRAASPVLAFLEDKYDGMRAQVHCGDPETPGRVAIYSRNREDITHSFPELAEAFAHVTEPLILDGEILGWDYAADDGRGQALPFAIMGQRIGRKTVPDAVRTQIPAVFMVFDVLFAGGELTLPLPLTERRAQLEALVQRWSAATVAPLNAPHGSRAAHTGQQGLFSTEASGAGEGKPRMMLSPTQRVADAEAIDAAYKNARARANEGVMLKAANSAYLPGRRGLAWVKLKRELGTLDVVITGAEFGSGRRARLLSDYTFAIRGENGELLNVGKAYSGVTDAEILELTDWLHEHTLVDHGHFRTVEPLMILEVAFNNIMRSTRHASGFALRFPRILHIRRDKPLEEIDTLARVEEIYLSQKDRPDESNNVVST